MSAEDALARLEARVLGMGGLKKWLDTVDELRTLVAMGAPDIDRLVVALTLPDVEAQALAALLDAFALGAQDAVNVLADAEIEASTRRKRPSKEARAEVRGLDRYGRKAMDQALRLVAGGADAAAIVAPLLGHAASMRRRISDGITRAGNEGSTAVADAAGLPTVWVAETNACVDCLAYSGRVAKPGQDFPGGLTYGRPSRAAPDALPYPPRHPNCRCTVEPLHDRSYAEALRREADRSVLRGFSLESESMAVRVDAAGRLLKRGVDAPKSVIAYARNAVKRGEFTTRGRPR